ncbi:MAG: acetylxylan esterase [Eubacteriales bacterium]|nr:acetylxylan esterase [Eubacteriales bacterium]
MSVEIMPLEQMKTYRGTNPRPADFDEFWDRGLAQAAACETKVELKPAEFQAKGCECFDLYFSGVDGARIYAQYLRPAGVSEKVPVVFWFHGYSGNSGDWFTKLSWVQQGFAVAAMDCRGQGGKSQDPGGALGSTYIGHIIRGLDDSAEKLLFRQTFLDTVMLVRAVSAFSEIDETRMAVYGGSQGGGLSLVCAALNPQICCAAVQFPFLCDYKRVYDLDCMGSAYEELRYFFRTADPRHERETEFFTRLGYIDVQYLAERIRADVLWGTALKDQACPASTQFAAYNRLTCKKEMVIYPDFGHEDIRDYMDLGFQFVCRHLRRAD